MNFGHELRVARRGLMVRAVAIAAGFVVVTLLDRWIWREMRLEKDVFEKVRVRDWYMLCREAGYLPTWVLVGVCVMLAERARRGRVGAALRDAAGLPAAVAWWSRGAVVILAAGLGGLAAEIVKLVVRRWRPGETGAYVFDWVVDAGVKGPGLGFVSSHAGVAFAAAFAMGRLFPGTRGPLLVWALGCCATRLLAGAHFATDCYGAAVLSYAVVSGLFRLPVIDELVRTMRRAAGIQGSDGEGAGGIR